MRFYLYSKPTAKDFPSRFTFAVPELAAVKAESFLLFFGDGDTVCLGKIYSVRKSTTFDQNISVYEAVNISLDRDALLRSVRKSNIDTLFDRVPYQVDTEKSDLVRKAILRRNRPKVDEEYFRFDQKVHEDYEIGIQAVDAINTALRIFGWKPQDIPPLREEQILDYDIGRIFGERVAQSPDGKHFFIHNGRRLYLHKTDRTKFERWLGVDLIYNFLDQRRIIFIQYKCVAAGGRTFERSNDRNMNRQIKLMKSLPGITDCCNFSAKNGDELRLCRCPVFVKLCAREMKLGNSIPEGSYFSLCVWNHLYNDKSNRIMLGEGAHINNQQFQELVKAGLIGSIPSQSAKIQEHLISVSNDTRLQLIFDDVPEGNKKSRS